MNLLTPTGWKDIADVNPGDELVAYDVNTGQQIINQLLSKQLVTVPEEESTFYNINGKWTLYANQSVWVDNRVDHAFNLKVGDTIYDWQDADVAVTSVEALSGTEWWRLEVSGDHSYIADELTLHNASRYWVGGGSSANWNATANTNWGSSSGVQDNASVPSSADDVIFDGAGVGGNTNSTISATITILSLNITSGYTATMTHNAVLTIAGNWTMSNSYTIAGSSNITIGITATITSNNQIWPNSIVISGNGRGTITLVGNFKCLGNTSYANTGIYEQIINATTSETWSTNGITPPVYVYGTAIIVLTGGQVTGTIYNGITFDSSAQSVTISGTLLVGGIITYTSGTVITTGSTLQVAGASLNTNGITWNNVILGLANYGFMTITLLSNFSCTGSTTVSNGIYSVTFNGSGYTYSTVGLTISNQLSGTAEVILTGGTWSSTAYMSNKLTLNSGANTITISGTVLYQSNTIKYSSGTISHINNSTLNIQGPVNLDTNGMSWNNVNLDVSNGNNTITLISNFLCGGTTTFGTGIYTNTVNSTTNQTWTTNGLTSNREISFGSTISEIILTGGTWSGAASVNKNLTIAGNVSVTGNVYFYNGTLKRTAGSITGGGTINLTASCTLDTQGSEWSVNTTLSNTNSQIYTINSLYVITGTLTFGTAANTTFAGAAGFSVATLLNSNTSTVNVNLKDGNTYTVTGTMTVFQSRSGSQVLFTSSHASNRAILTLRNPSSCNCLASFTRIDASGGRTITTFNGTVTDCLNVISYNDLRPVAA